MAARLDMRIVLNNMQSAKQQAKDAAMRGMQAAETAAVADIVAGTPRDKGSLQNSERAEITQDASSVTMTFRAGGPSTPEDANHAGYVHDGTYKMRARPYLREGVERVAPMVMERVTSELIAEFA